MLRTVLSRRSLRRAARPLAGPAARVRFDSPAGELLEDRRLLSATGGPSGTLGPGAGTGDYDGTGELLPLSETFTLHSNPDANHTVFLDFDGHDLQDPGWNGGRRTQISAFSVDGDRDTFNDDELVIIQETWLRLSEQFLPFDVNITTEEPALDRLINEGGSDTRWGVRAIFGTPVSEIDGGAGTGGLAYVGSFDDARDNPTFIFDTAGNDSNGFAVAGAHEIGHTMGLSHDGTNSEDYYGGHGAGETAWGAVMGVSYTSNVIHFSRGEYEDADQQEDDLEIITTENGFDYRDDDFGDTPATAGSLLVGRTVGPLTEVTQAGIIERNTDFDVFAFATGGGDFTMSVSGPVLGQTLDIVAEVYTADGELVARSAGNDILDASFDLDLQAGEYVLVVTGGGREAVPGDEGYSDYGSLGSYRIAATIENYIDVDNPDDPGDDGDDTDDGGGDDGSGDGGTDDPPRERPRPRGKVRVYGGRLRTNENGKSAKFRVKLNRQPTEDVIIRLRMSDLTEGALVTEKLVFTPENWNRLQTVRVFGMDDADDDGARKFKVLTARASSDDAAYDRVNVKDMRGINRDNDSANRIRDMRDRYRDQFRKARREARREERRDERRAERRERREQRREEREARRRRSGDSQRLSASALPPRDDAGAGDADRVFGGGGDDLFGGV